MPAEPQDAIGPAGGGSRLGSTRSASSSAPPPASSFFIIHEPDVIIRPSDGGGTSPQRTAGSPSRTKKSRNKLLSSASSPLATASSSRLPTRRAPSDEERERSEVVREQSPLAVVPSAAENQGDAALSILNRCGSAPDLPLHSTLSSSVYSSSKKRLQRTRSTVSGAHQIALQRSRLTPLPIDIRTGTLKRSAQGDQSELQSVIDAESPGQADSRAVSALKEQIVGNEAAIAGLKQRLSEMERERAASASSWHALDKQNQTLRQENQQLQSEKTSIQHRADQLALQLKQCQHKLDKLADRYATVYAGLQKLADKGQASSTPDKSAAQTVVQALARENQDLQRKLRVLEARHAEDKALASNHEKRLKRLRAEMEAMHHLDASNADNTESAQHPPQDTEQPPSSLAQSMISPPRSASRRVVPDAEAGVVTGSVDGKATDSPLAIQHRSSVSGANSNHLVSAEDYQFIDPNILKVLDKVDSQFSIANAISLSATLKKWINSCLHVVCSTHVPTVLQAMLKRAIELLHCEHAAVFQVDHGAKRLIALCSERGEESWELPLDKGILGYAARQNAMCNVRRAYDDPRFYSSTDTITGHSSREVLCIPIVHELQPQYRSNSVLAVLQMWNTTHQKPFTANDQILGSLLAIHVGAVVLQSKVGTLLLKANKKFHQIAELQHEVAEYVQSLSPPSQPPSSNLAAFTPVAAVDLVAAAEKKLAECLGIKHVRVFGLDTELMRIWRVGRAADSSTGCVSRIRKYANAASSLCALAIHSRDVIIVSEPASEPSFNDMVDMAGGAGGLYLAAITSPWSTHPLGMVQVARSAKAVFIPLSKSSGAGRSDQKSPTTELSEVGAAAAFAREREKEQRSEDALLIELIAIFCRSFAGLLLHARAQQMHVECPAEVRQAQLASLSDHLSWLEGEEQRQQALLDEQSTDAERLVLGASSMEQRILDSIQRDKLANSHSRQSTPKPITPEDPSATQCQTHAPGRRSSTSSYARVDTPPSVSTPATSSRRISSAGSHLRTRTPQRALATASEAMPSDSTASNVEDDALHCDEGRSSHQEDARGEDETPAAFVEVIDGTSLLSLEPPSRLTDTLSDNDLEDEEEWEAGTLPASIASYPSGVDHVVMEDLDDGEELSELTELGATGPYTGACDDDAGGNESDNTAPDDISSRTGSTTATSGLISTDSAYSIDLG